MKNCNKVNGTPISQNGRFVNPFFEKTSRLKVLIIPQREKRTIRPRKTRAKAPKQSVYDEDEEEYEEETVNEDV